MRKLLPIFLAALLLCGCAREEAEEFTATAAPATVQVAEDLTCFGAAPEGQMYGMGSRLLIYDGTCFTVIGNGQYTLEEPDVQGISTGALGAAYYKDGTVTLLNPMLRVNDTLTLPENTDSVPVTDVSGRIVYYTAGGELRAVGFGDKLPHLLRAYENITLVPKALYGGMLVCDITDIVGLTTAARLSTETGEPLDACGDYEKIYTCGGDYIALQQDGLYTRRIWARGDSSVDLRLPEGYDLLAMTDLGPALRQGNRVVLIDETGKCVDACTLPGAITEAVGGSSLWLKCDDGRLYRWNMECGEAAEFGVTLRDIYTADNPDTAGLNQLKARAKEMKARYGCNVLIDDTAVSRTGGHTLEREYQVDTVSQVMEDLEAALSQASLPKNLSVCIVRSVDGDTAPVKFKQWRFTYLLLPAGCDITAALQLL